MKINTDKLIETAFSDELIHIAPEAVDTNKITNKVFEKAGIEKAEPQIVILPKVKPKRNVFRMALVAVAIVVLTGTGVFAANEILKLSRNEISYFSPASSTVSQDTVHDTTEPVFHQGLNVDLESFNTPVGTTVTDSGISMTLDTVAMDDNFVDLFFTVDYGKAIDFETIFPDRYPGNGGVMPEYSELIHSFAPSMWLSINDSRPSNEDAIWSVSSDAYFADDQTIKLSQRYILSEDYPDEIMLYAGMHYMVDADGNDIANYGTEGVDQNKFQFSVAVDKSEASEYTKDVEPGVYTFKLNRGITQGVNYDNRDIDKGYHEIDEKLDIRKLRSTPFGATLTLGFEYPQPGEEGYEDFMDQYAIDVYGVQFSDLYMEDNEGNVLDIYHEPGNGFAMYADGGTEEILNLSPTAESITVMPLIYDYESGSSEARTYQLKDIIGQKVETSSLGGFIVKNYTVSGGTAEFTLEPYGKAQTYGVMTEFLLDDDNITLAGGRSGLIREQYDRETGLFTYAVDYYAATEEELKAIETVRVHYDGGVSVDRSQAVTLELKAAE